MKFHKLILSGIFLFFALSASSQTSMYWCEKENATKMDTSCFRQPVKGIKAGITVDVVSFKLTVTTGGADYTFESKSDRLSDEMIQKIMAAPEKEMVLYFNEVKGMSSTGLSFHTFNGSYTLVKPEPVKSTKNSKGKKDK